MAKVHKSALNGVWPPAPGHVILLQISLQRRQLPRTAPSDDVLLGEARGEHAQHHLRAKLLRLAPSHGRPTHKKWFFWSSHPS